MSNYVNSCAGAHERVSGMGSARVTVPYDYDENQRCNQDRMRDLAIPTGSQLIRDHAAERCFAIPATPSHLLGFYVDIPAIGKPSMNPLPRKRTRDTSGDKRYNPFSLYGTHTGVRINIVIDANGKASKAEASGSLSHITTEAERRIFGLQNDAVLKRAVARNCGGRVPDNVYWNADSDPHKSHTKYGIVPVHTIMEPVSATIVEVTSVPTIIGTYHLVNKSNKTADFHASVHESVEDRVITTWDHTYETRMDQSIEYGIGFLGKGIKGNTSFGFTGSWGKGGAHWKTHTVGNTHGIKVPLDPGEGATATLMASKGTVRVKVKYRSRLDGYFAVDFKNGYRGHTDYFPVAGQITRYFEMSKYYYETIEVGYYCSAQVELRDLEVER